MAALRLGFGSPLRFTRSSYHGARDRASASRYVIVRLQVRGHAVKSSFVPLFKVIEEPDMLRMVAVTV